MAKLPDNLTHKYLNLHDLKSLRHLVFSPRHAIEGQYAGRHASPQRGQSVEFSDYRQYLPGDEIGDIDWKIYGRSDKLVVKLFEHQTDLVVNLLVDASASMDYRGVKALGASMGLSKKGDAQKQIELTKRYPSKYDYACQLAASIAFLISQQQDKVGMGMSQSGLGQFIPPGSSYRHLNRLLNELDGTQPEGIASLKDSLDQMFRISKRRSVLIVFSDFLEDRDALIKALSQFTKRGSEVILFQILHPDEIELPENIDTAMFTDSETNQKISVNVNDIRKEYKTNMMKFLREWSHEARTRNIDYNLVNTKTTYRKALEGYLFSRASRA